MTPFFAFLYADAALPPSLPESNLCATTCVAIVAFAIFALILAIPLLRGKKIKRQCACSASREVVRILEERERAKRDAVKYDPATVDTSNLPTTSPEVAEYAR